MFGNPNYYGAANPTNTGGLVGINNASPSYNMDVGGTLNTSGNVTIKSTTASSSTTTGALVVSGGAGIPSDLYVGGSLYLPSSSSALNYYNAGLYDGTVLWTGLWNTAPSCSDILGKNWFIGNFKYN